MRYLIPLFTIALSGCVVREYADAVVDQAPEMLTAAIQTTSTAGWQAAAVGLGTTIVAAVYGVYEQRRAKRAELKICDMEMLATRNSKPTKDQVHG